MKITIIAPHSFGYLNLIIDELRGYENVTPTIINFDQYRFKYTSKTQKVQNFFSKILLGKNIKEEYKTQNIKRALNNIGTQDIILVVRPDKLQRKLLQYAKQHCNTFLGLYFDSIANFPRKKKRIAVFDKVFTYEPSDARQFNLAFVTNFIPFNETEENHGKGVFNISSHDERFNTIEAVAKYLRKIGHPYKIMVRSDKGTTSEYVEIIEKNIPLEEVKKMQENYNVLLDIQKENQEGLTFRVFEALGLQKKLITTNPAITEYDFYNPQNMFVLNKNDIKIPKQFLETPYTSIPETILKKYRKKAWIETVFGIQESTRL